MPGVAGTLKVSDVVEDKEDPAVRDIQDMALRTKGACQGQAEGKEWLKELK